MLEHACRAHDTAHRLESAVHDAPLTVPGSMKQPVAHPLLPELRATRQQVAGLLAQLGIEEEDERREESPLDTLLRRRQERR